jgi:DNA repair exonuclease SbcCD ATPase subunit
VDLIQIATELYDEVPAKFTAARNARAKVIASGDDRALAGDIRQLPKASASAWALNHLAGTDTKTVEEFGTLGAKLREAQLQANRSELERLIKRRKSLVGATIKSIQGFCRDSGVRLSPSAVSEIEQSLQAALADEDGATAVFSRRLIKPIRSDGLDPVDLSGAVAGPATQSRTARSPTSGREAEARPKRSTPKPDAALVARTRRVADKADAAVEQLRKQRSDLDRERDALERDVEDLQQQFDALEKRRYDLERRDSQVEGDTRKAVAASREAHRALERATTSP